MEFSLSKGKPKALGEGKNVDELSLLSSSASGLDLRSSQREFGLEFQLNGAILWI